MCKRSAHQCGSSIQHVTVRSLSCLCSRCVILYVDMRCMHAIIRSVYLWVRLHAHKQSECRSR